MFSGFVFLVSAGGTALCGDAPEGCGGSLDTLSWSVLSALACSGRPESEFRCSTRSNCESLDWAQLVTCPNVKSERPNVVARRIAFRRRANSDVISSFLLPRRRNAANGVYMFRKRVVRTRLVRDSCQELGLELELLKTLCFLLAAKLSKLAVRKRHTKRIGMRSSRELFRLRSRGAMRGTIVSGLPGCIRSLDYSAMMRHKLISPVPASASRESVFPLRMSEASIRGTSERTLFPNLPESLRIP